MDTTVFDLLARYGWLIAIVLIVAFNKAILRVFFGTVIVSKDEIGILNKKWVLFGKNRTFKRSSGFNSGA